MNDYGSAALGVVTILFSLLWLLAPVLILGAIVYFVVRRRSNGTGITGYRALLAYFHIVTAVSVVITAVGAGYLAFAGLSQIYGGRAPIDDAITLGFTLLGTGAVVCVLHVLGRRAVERPQDTATSTLKRIYLFSMLAIFSLAGITSLPSAINDTITYHLRGYKQGNGPAEPLAVAAITVPLWGYYLWRVLRDLRHGAKADGPTQP